MGDIGLPLHGREPDGDDAVDALLRASEEHVGELTLVTLGPLTNVARALERDPSFAERVPRTVVMGAVADHVGNVSPVAEFNMWCDPHAVELVLASGLALELVGWDISRKHAVVTPDLADRLRAVGSSLAEFCIDIQCVVADFCATETKLAGFDLPDPIAMAYAIDPAVATETRRLHLAVETESALTRGMVVVDLLGLTGHEPNALVVTAADDRRFQQMLATALT
jgi:purine nucleosidase